MIFKAGDTSDSRGVALVSLVVPGSIPMRSARVDPECLCDSFYFLVAFGADHSTTCQFETSLSLSRHHQAHYPPQQLGYKGKEEQENPEEKGRKNITYRETTGHVIPQLACTSATLWGAVARSASQQICGSGSAACRTSRAIQKDLVQAAKHFSLSSPFVASLFLALRPVSPRSVRVRMFLGCACAAQMINCLPFGTPGLRGLERVLVAERTVSGLCTETPEGFHRHVHKVSLKVDEEQ